MKQLFICQLDCVKTFTDLYLRSSYSDTPKDLLIRSTSPLHRLNKKLYDFARYLDRIDVFDFITKEDLSYNLYFIDDNDMCIEFVDIVLDALIYNADDSLNEDMLNILKTCNVEVIDYEGSLLIERG